jgi:hypothetical protein
MNATVTVWVLVTYVLNVPPPMVAPPNHVLEEQLFKTKALCLSAKSKSERDDTQHGTADDFIYKCVPRQLDDAE